MIDLFTVSFSKISNLLCNARPEDSYAHEGAVEQDTPEQKGNTSLNGQMGHRNKPKAVDTLDTDFPEPGENPEHSGEPNKS